jgi:transposase
MAQEISVIVSDDDRARLEAIVGDRNHSHKHVQRARIVLLSAERLAVAEVARRAGISRAAVWRWQRRFAEQGVSGLLRDKTRPPGTPPLPADTVARVVAMTCAEPPGEATHWTGRAMAKQAGISLSSVQRIWAEHDLQPHRLRTFNARTIRRSPRSCARSSGCTSTRRPTAWSSRSTKRARSRPSTAPSPACR